MAIIWVDTKPVTHIPKAPPPKHSDFSANVYEYLDKMRKLVESKVRNLCL